MQTREELKNHLFYEHGLSLRGFARKEGFNPMTVIMTIHRHWGQESTPQGKKAIKIINLLKKYCEQKGATHAN